MQLGRNPYFIGILSAIEPNSEIAKRMEESQSLFYWNPFCNMMILIILFIIMMSQSLFYWNPFCNGNCTSCSYCKDKSQSLFYWNPFCNPIKKHSEVEMLMTSQSLFYWNPFCNTPTPTQATLRCLSRNPYFIGILSAIKII